MKHKVFALAIMLTIIMTVALSHTASKAASGASITGVSGNTVDYQFIPNTDDGGGIDRIIEICFNANGDVVDTDSGDRIVSNSYVFSSFTCSDIGGDFAPRIFPLRWEIRDVDRDVDTNNIDEVAYILSMPLLAVYPVPGPGITVPNVGTVQIRTNMVQPAFEEPNGNIVKLDGNDLFLPHDADGSGYDTYTVTHVQLVSERVWVQIFLGSEQFVWVPLDSVIPVTFLPEPSNTTSE